MPDYEKQQHRNIVMLAICLVILCSTWIVKAALEANVFVLERLCAKYDFNEDNEINMKDFAMFAEAYSEFAAIKKEMHDAQHPQLIVNPNATDVKEYGVDFNDPCFVTYYLTYKDERSIDVND
jgi:hypothetical protein